MCIVDHFRFVAVLCGDENIELRSGSTSTILSPLYPSNYPNMFTCTWFVTSATESKRPVVEFIVFTTELASDILHIGEGNTFNTTLVSLSGFSAPKKVVSRTVVLWLRFESDQGISDKGFNISLYLVDSDGKFRRAMS